MGPKTQIGHRHSFPTGETHATKKQLVQGWEVPQDLPRHRAPSVSSIISQESYKALQEVRAEEKVVAT